MSAEERRAWYAALPPGRDKRGRAWTMETVRTALRMFVADEGRLPLTPELCSSEGLPRRETLVGLFGSVSEAFLGLDLPLPPVPEAPSLADWVECPRCEKRWYSPNRRLYRRCAACHQDPRIDEGVWMDGRPVPREGVERCVPRKTRTGRRRSRHC